MYKKTIILCLFLVAKMILQYVVADPIYELQRDEYLHLDQAKHLAWGFHSVPPITSWLSWIILQLGNGYFWVKLFPALFGALTLLTVWKTVTALKGGLFACVLTATALLLSVFLRINLLYQPNSLDYLCWTLVYYTLIRYLQTENNNWLYGLAIAFAIGFLNKYNIVFCALGLLPALLLTPQRKLLLKPAFYGALMLALVLISPNLWWQYQNHFPVFKHMQELKETQLVNVSPMDFLKEQLLFFLGSIFILLSGFISLLVYQPFKPFRLLFFAYLFTLAIFLFLSAKGYYAIGLYPIFFAFGAVYLEQLLQQGWKYHLRYAAIAFVALLAVPLFMIALPLKSPNSYVAAAAKHEPFSEHKWEDGKVYSIPQDFADMLGWKELARKVDSIYRLQHDPHLFVFCDNYGQAGAINYYTKIKGLSANSFNADYVNWVNLSQPIHTMINVKDVGEDLDDEHSLFENVTIVVSITNPYAREKGTRIVLLSKPKADVNKFIQNEIELIKKN
jgi:hypothetical protein